VAWQRAVLLPNEYAGHPRSHPRYSNGLLHHPYRADCVGGSAGGERGARPINGAGGMGRSGAPRCDAFYARSPARLRSSTHGVERASMPSIRIWQSLLLRRALEHAWRVVVAHCASMEKTRSDRAYQSVCRELRLFARLMTSALEGGSRRPLAITQINRQSLRLPHRARSECNRGC